MARPKVRTTQPRRDLVPRARRLVSPWVQKAWERALEVSDIDVAKFIPSKAVIDVGEALLAGQLSVEMIANFSGHTPLVVRHVMVNPVAMAWISRQIHQLFRHRAGIVDAALYQRAVAGDVNAIKLFYFRMGQLADEKTVHHTYSGGVRLDTLNDEDLRKLIKDKNATLPAEFTVISEAVGDPIPGPGGVRAPDAAGPPSLLPPVIKESPETEEVP